MTIELPGELRSRPANAADAQAIYELVAACEGADDGVVEVDIHDVTRAFERLGFDLALDSLLVLERDEPVAWAELYRGRGEGDVRPPHRGRGIGSALVSWIEARARELGEATVGQTKADANAAARELFLANGYVASWTSWIIRTELDASPDPPIVPAGISIRSYEPSDAPSVHQVIGAAFCEWEDRDPTPFDVWASLVVRHPAFAPELSPLAFDGDELVGVVLSFDFPEEGWVEQVATRATHRRRGIAQALLRTAFVGYAERGRRVAGVSTDSRTGALGLYENVGMRVVRQYTRFTNQLTA